MKKKMTSVVLAMVVAVCMFSMRVEASSPLGSTSSSEVVEPVVISTIHTEESDEYELGEVVMAYYVVVKGNTTIESIADRLQITKEYLLSENDGRMFELDGELPIYAYIALPEIYWEDVEQHVYYFVQQGDNLWEISEYFHTSIADIQKLNPQITDSNLIYAESFIRIK